MISKSRRTESNRIRELEKENKRLRQEVVAGVGTIRSPDTTTTVNANDTNVNITISGVSEYTFRSEDILVNGNALFNPTGGILGLYDGTYYVGFSAPTLTSNISWDLPAKDNNGCIESDGSGTLTIRQDNLSATVNPSATDDSNAGYSVRSVWINTTATTVWMCIDATASAAIWNQIG